MYRRIGQILVIRLGVPHRSPGSTFRSLSVIWAIFILLKLLMMKNSLLRNVQYSLSYSSEELFQIGFEQFNLSTAGKGCQNLDRWSDMVNNLFRFCMYNEFSFSFLNVTCGEIHEMSLEPTLLIQYMRSYLREQFHSDLRLEKAGLDASFQEGHRKQAPYYQLRAVM